MHKKTGGVSTTGFFKARQAIAFGKQIMHNNGWIICGRK
jgi:hypothetical protein